MILITHIVVALASIVCSTFALIAPSRAKLNLTYGLILLTLASGSYLVWSTHSPLLQSCMAGLIYVGVVLSGVLSARHRLAVQEVRKDL